MSVIDSIQISGTIYTLSAQTSGGNNVVELTQAEYDALVTGGTVDPTAFYIITDAQPTDISQYWTSAQTQSAITQAVSGKQDTLSAGTGIDITNNVISVTGGSSGGKAIEGGHGITVTTGATADTVSLDLPISGGSGNYSLKVGNPWVSANGYANFAGGFQITTQNYAEFGYGQYNKSNKASNSFGVSGNTLFTIGNGNSNSARHNAFEIRENGDVYIPDTNSSGTYYEKPMIKLQDGLVTTAQITAWNNKLDASTFDSVMASYDTVLYGLGNRVTAVEQSVSGKQDTLSAGTGIDITNNVISVTGGSSGGKAIEAGRGISVTTGATADTVSFDLPISAGTGSNSIAEGVGTSASGALSHAEGIDNVASGTGSHAEGVETNANGDYSHSEGVGTVTNNMGEHAEGWYNASNTGNSESAQTLFSVGNGSSSARHNAFEIRKNGDIYFNDGTNDIKLQDKFTEINNTIGDIETLLAAI